MIERLLYQENIIKSSTAQKCMKQSTTELKGEINNTTVIVGHINIPLSTMDRASRQKNNKDGRLE